MRVNARRGLRLLIAAMLAGLGVGPSMVTPVSAASTLAGSSVLVDPSMANGGDVAREAGLWPVEAMVPQQSVVLGRPG